MSTPPQLFVHEFVSGGGWPVGDLPEGLAAEGAGMLRSILADFRLWGAVRTITTLDERLADLSLPADEVISIAAGYHSAIFSSILARMDAALIIAPETDGILARLSGLVQDAGVLLLGSSPEAVTIAGNKWACYQRFRQSNLQTPLTQLARAADAGPQARVIGYPLVIKPVDGVGCEGVCLVTDESELAAALTKLCQVTLREEIILQSFIDGIHASVSLLVAEEGALPLSLNSQAIATGSPFAYKGGTVPLLHPSRERACSVAEAAVRLLPGLKGYVGVDLILKGDDVWLIEINPRITTSYLGLRCVLQLNLAQAIWRACCEGVLPEQAPINGQATFSKNSLLV